MRNKKITKILFAALIAICINIPISFAQEEIKIIPNKDNIQLGEELEIAVNIPDTELASFTLELYFNEQMLEYISGPSNSNNSNGRILYTWVSQTGENVKDITIDKFLFTGKSDGFSNVIVRGEFYNSKGDQIQLNNGIKQIQIGHIENSNEDDNHKNTENDAQRDNTKLSVLRINEEGISPHFNPDIREYYFIANKDINKLQVTAIPENINSIVTITGNENFKMGINVINIEVQSEDKSKTDVYKIYVTKTESVEMANANLANLAIRQATLNPEFETGITYYKAEAPNDISNLDILAVPENENASIKIIGNDELKIGSNRLEVHVTAQDGITNKKYVLEVYRRNKEEELISIEDQQIQAERLSAIIEENETKKEQNNSQANNDDKNNNYNKDNKNNIYIITFLVIGPITFLGVVLYTKMKKRK